MKVLDLFCCGGGASAGYARAGCDVVGVDIVPQPEYPFPFVLADALEYVKANGADYDLIHASPPCQGYSSGVSSRSSPFSATRGKDEPKLIPAVREALQSVGVPYVIENVIGARRELHGSLLLCGTMFGLMIARHRIFEVSEWIVQPEHESCKGESRRFADACGWEFRDMSVTGKGRRSGTSERWSELMGIDWPLRQSQISEAIPPVYTEYIAREMFDLPRMEYGR